MTMTPPIRDTKRYRPSTPTPRRLTLSGRKQLVIETSDSKERWRELLRTIEDLARLGETIDCSLPPLECQYSSTPLRGSLSDAIRLPEPDPDSTVDRLG
jgi:hypothetical protein